MLQMLLRHPRPKETQNYWTSWLQTCGSNVCGHEIIWKTGFGLSARHHWTPCIFAYRANTSVDDAVNMGLHFILQHLDRPGTCVRILFADFSSAFNAIILDTLQNKLTQLSVPTSICQWITSFLTDRQQLVRLGKFSSSTHTISTGAPQVLCSLPTALPCLHEWLHI